MGFPGDTVVKNLPANAGGAGDMGSIPGLGRSPGEGNGNSLWYSCLENSMDRGAWRAVVHGATKYGTRLSTHTHVYWTPGRWCCSRPCGDKGEENRYKPCPHRAYIPVEGGKWCWNGARHYGPCPPCPLPAFCLWKNFSQIISVIRKVRKCKTKAAWQDKAVIVSKQNQGPLVPFKGSR